MEGAYFDRSLLVTCIDGLGRRHGDSLVYQKDADTVGVVLRAPLGAGLASCRPLEAARLNCARAG